MDEKAFEALDGEFQTIVAQLQTDPALATFRCEYEKLHGALKKSHDSEKRLMSKIRELNAELVANAAKVIHHALHALAHWDCRVFRRTFKSCGGFARSTSESFVRSP